MAITISIVNEKGGVGKTATTFNLAAELNRRGNKVLAIDLDSQGNLSTTWQADKNAFGVADIILRNVEVQQAIQRREGYFDLISGNSENKKVESQNAFGVEFALLDALEPIQEAYDYILIDTPPFVQKLVGNALIASDYLVIPAVLETYSLDGLLSLSNSVKNVQRHGAPGKSLKIAGIVLTRYRKGQKLTNNLTELFNMVAANLEIPIFETHVRETVSVREAAALCQSCYEFDKNSHSAQDYAALTDELLKKIGKN